MSRWNFMKNGQQIPLTVKVEDTLPIGAEIDILDGTDIPEGWVEVDDPNEYSTNEIRIGTWLGKPLYRKTVSCGALPNNTSKSINTNIPNISRVVKIYGYSLNDALTFPLPHTNPNPVSLSFFNTASNNNGITIQTTTDRSAFTETYVTIEYTKTTD